MAAKAVAESERLFDHNEKFLDRLRDFEAKKTITQALKLHFELPEATITFSSISNAFTDF
ncbi:MAG: hypothetical protein KG029_08260 [Bacteroidetes bacterium]|nr:hypothetical protein [Bacteroidota bacterium]